MGLLTAVWRTLVRFGRDTSISGLNEAARHSSSPLRSCAWMSVFVAGSALTVFSLYQNAHDYMAYSVGTIIDFDFETASAFPAVTICNLNRIHCGNLMHTMTLQHDILYGLNAANASNATIVDTRNRLNTLTNLFTLTGCRDQLCSSVDNDTLANVTGRVAVAIALANCPVNSSLRDTLCLRLLLLKDRKLFSKSFSSLVAKAWASARCTCPGSTSGNATVDNCARVTPATSPASRKPQSTQPPASLRTTPPDGNVDAAFFTALFALDSKTRKLIGHSFGDKVDSYSGDVRGFIYSCSYQGINCLDQSYWNPTLSVWFGNCYTFATGPNKTSLTGLRNGLSVELYLDQPNYMQDGLSREAGARLVVHDPSKPPLPEQEGVSMQPGTASSIAIQKHEISRLTSPYRSNCTTTWNTTDFRNKFLASNKTYSMEICQRYCLQQAVSASCQCIMPNLMISWMLESQLANSTRVCNVQSESNNTDYDCFFGVFKAFDRTRKTCSCNLECKETTFSTQVSSSTWPSNQYWTYLEPNGSTISIFEPSDSAGGKRDIQQNYVRAEVYYQTLNVRKVSQTPQYTTADLISNVGGSLGLYLGISMVMLFEVVELVASIAFNVVRIIVGIP